MCATPRWKAGSAPHTPLAFFSGKCVARKYPPFTRHVSSTAKYTGVGKREKAGLPGGLPGTVPGLLASARKRGMVGHVCETEVPSVARRHAVRMTAYAVQAIVAGAVALILSLAAAEPPAVEIKLSDQAVDFLSGGELIGRYQIQSPRSGGTLAKPYLWPLHGPA